MGGAPGFLPKEKNSLPPTNQYDNSKRGARRNAPPLGTISNAPRWAAGGRYDDPTPGPASYHVSDGGKSHRGHAFSATKREGLLRKSDSADVWLWRERMVVRSLGVGRPGLCGGNPVYNIDVDTRGLPIRIGAAAIGSSRPEMFRATRMPEVTREVEDAYARYYAAV